MAPNGFVILIFLAFTLELSVQKAASKACGFYYYSWYKSMHFCEHPAKLFLGKLNEDNQTDLICHHKDGRISAAFATKTGIFSHVQWRSSFKWCAGTQQKLHLGDFNGDGQDDLLCHDSFTGDMWIAFANAKGHYHGTDWHQRIPWCIGSNNTLIVGDFNGNKRADMLCHNKKSGKKSLAYSDCDGEFKGPEWSAFHGWCRDSDADIFVGDFNGDGRADLLCDYRYSGKSIIFANYDGKFTGSYWVDKNTTWCSRGDEPQAAVHLVVGDFNGDGRADWLCQNNTSGYIRIAFSSKEGKFHGTGWEKDFRWCPGNALAVGNFNNDRLNDMLCTDEKGSFWIAYGECYGKNDAKKKVLS